MEEVLCKGSVFSACQCRSSSLSPKGTAAFLTNLSRSSINPARSLSPLKGILLGKSLVIQRQKGKTANGNINSVPVNMALSIGNAMRWWKKGAQFNIKEITSAQDLVDSLIGAGDKLAILDFFSPGCAGCKALHPKIYQFAERNPDVLFLPIKKFKDALDKHNTERCSLGPTVGLEESELLILAANKDLCFNYTRKEEFEFTVPESMKPVHAIPELHELVPIIS